MTALITQHLESVWGYLKRKENLWWLFPGCKSPVTFGHLRGNSGKQIQIFSLPLSVNNLSLNVIFIYAVNPLWFCVCTVGLNVPGDLLLSLCFSLYLLKFTTAPKKIIHFPFRVNEFKLFFFAATVSQMWAHRHPKSSWTLSGSCYKQATHANTHTHAHTSATAGKKQKNKKLQDSVLNILCQLRPSANSISLLTLGMVTGERLNNLLIGAICLHHQSSQSGNITKDFISGH